MDVVPANPDDWDFNPYELSVNGDELRGRGVTDCLVRTETRESKAASASKAEQRKRESE